MNVEEFMKDYYLHTKYNLKVQLPHLVKLADHYSKRFSETQHWADCIKVRLGYYNSNRLQWTPCWVNPHYIVETNSRITFVSWILMICLVGSCISCISVL